MATAPPVPFLLFVIFFLKFRFSWLERGQEYFILFEKKHKDKDCMLRWAGFLDFIKFEDLNIEQLQYVKCFQGKFMGPCIEFTFYP